MRERLPRVIVMFHENIASDILQTVARRISSGNDNIAIDNQRFRPGRRAVRTKSFSS
jgi:hypothetical protein